ncbi:MAG: MBL fold metallo-hydrolase [Minisyncoccia bacterium]
MVITYHGLEFFKVTFGNTTIAFNPISKDSKIKGPRFGADVALISVKDRDMNGADAVTRGEKETFVINGPGEYEIGGLTVKGFASKSEYGGEERMNTIYLVNLENMNLCFLGALAHKDLDPKVSEELEDIDVLFTPIGGEGVMSGAESYKMAVKLEPALIIPMHYDDKSLKVFLKEAGAEKTSPIDKLTLKKKDLEGKESDVVVLKVE